jgi:uncharacterized protein YbaR (Trm112 family)
MSEDVSVTPNDTWPRDILRCPSCKSALRDGQNEADGSPELQCTGCSLAYRVDDGIPVMLISDARTRE